MTELKILHLYNMQNNLQSNALNLTKLNYSAIIRHFNTEAKPLPESRIGHDEDTAIADTGE